VLSICVISLTDPLRNIDLALSSTLFSIYIPPKHHTNIDTSFYIKYIIQIPLPAVLGSDMRNGLDKLKAKIEEVRKDNFVENDELPSNCVDNIYSDDHLEDILSRDRYVGILILPLTQIHTFIDT